jgi:hypothetical protein
MSETQIVLEKLTEYQKKTHNRSVSIKYMIQREIHSTDFPYQAYPQAYSSTILNVFLRSSVQPTGKTTKR